MMNIYDPLIWRGNPDGEFYPGLATVWEAATDGLSFTFTLRSDVKFHDGTPFNGEAVKKFFDRVHDPETQSGFAANLLGPYETTEMTDDFNITVKMSAPFAPALDGMSQAFLSITSPSAVEKDPTAFLKNPVGTGFMKFKEWVEADHISMVRNEEYAWGSPMFTHTGAAYLEEVEFRFFPDHPTRLAALEAGDVNMIEQLPDSELARFEGDSSYIVQLGFSPGIPSIVALNTEKAPLDDLNVRKAFASAVDRQSLVEVANFNATKVAYGPLWEGTPYYSADVESYYPFDLNAAGTFLDEAGWTAGSGDIREKDGQPLALTWVMGDAQAHYAELLQAQLRAAGFDVALSKAAPAAITDAAKAGDTNISTNGWISSDPVVLSNCFHTKNIGAFNLSRYSNPELDTILDNGEKTVDPTEREKLYHDAQVMIMDEALIVPMWGIHRNNALQSKYKDVKRDFRTYIWLYDAWVEE
jgi:peptide/nickel transport system substrate-binding protein